MGHLPTRLPRALVVLVLIGGIAPAAGDEIRVIYDPRPEADIPREARGAGTTPDPDGKGRPGSNITFGIVTDLKDYGPLRNVMPGDIHAVTVRHYDGSFRDTQAVQRYLTSVPRIAPGPRRFRSRRSRRPSSSRRDRRAGCSSGARGAWSSRIPA